MFWDDPIYFRRPLVFWADPLCFDTTPGFSSMSNYSNLKFYLLFSGKSVTYLLLRSLVMLTVVRWTPQACAVGWFSKSSSVKTLGKKEFRISAFSPSVSTVVASGSFKSLTPIRVLIFDLAYLYNALGFFHIQKNNIFKVSNSFSHLSFYHVCGTPIFHIITFFSCLPVMLISSCFVFHSIYGLKCVQGGLPFLADPPTLCLGIYFYTYPWQFHLVEPIIVQQTYAEIHLPSFFSISTPRIVS